MTYAVLLFCIAMAYLLWPVFASDKPEMEP